MIEKALMGFFLLVGLFFVTMYPDQLISFIQMFVDSAYKLASALGHLNLHTHTAGTSTTGTN